MSEKIILFQNHNKKHTPPKKRG